jgi:hypothetical protein
MRGIAWEMPNSVGTWDIAAKIAAPVDRSSIDLANSNELGKRDYVRVQMSNYVQMPDRHDKIR